MGASGWVWGASEAPKGNEWVQCVCASRPIGTHTQNHSAEHPNFEITYRSRTDSETHPTERT